MGNHFGDPFRVVRGILMRVAGGRRMLSFQPPYRLHLGCGKLRFDGWINIDADRGPGTADVLWDLRHGLPAGDSSCAAIYSEHFIEHLTVEEGLSLFRECRRALRPGGAMRIATPSLDAILEAICEGRWRDQDWLAWPEHRFIRTRAEMMNIAFRWWGHQWLYDREELHRRLGEAGFLRVRDCEWGKSGVPEFQGRETRADSLLICEVEK